MEIKNKIAVITGGAGGIGLKVVKRLLQNGIKFVALFELDNANTKSVFSDLEKEYGERVGFHACDVTDNAQLADNFDDVIKTHTTIDILLNNAGILNENAPALMIDINYKAVVMASLLFIERVGKHKGGQGGAIVNTASILGLKNYVLPIYCSTKHAVVSFTRTMDEHQFEITGVRVFAICPGVTETPLLSNIPNGLEFIRSEGIFEKYPVQSAESVAEAFIKIIKSGKSGDVWVAEDDLTPFAVKDIGDYKNLRISE